MDVMDNLDLTQSSDTTTEDVESPTPTYKEAMLLLEQLGVDHAGKFSNHCFLLQVPLLKRDLFVYLIFQFSILI